MDFRDILGGIQDVGNVLIKRGTAMGPLVPSLFLVPVFIFSAWLFRTTAVVGDVPIFSALFAIMALGTVIDYHRRYAAFAKDDPDRLQSEEYRIGMARTQMMAGKGLRQPVPEDSLPLKGAELYPPEQEAQADEEAGSDSTNERRTP